MDELIGVGRTAEIYAYGPGRVVKLLLHGFDPAALGAEAERTRAAYDVGIPVPGVHGPVTIQGRAGWVYDRLDGPLMLDEILRRPRSSGPLADLLAGVHADMHDRPGAGSLPSVRDRLAEKIEHAVALDPAARGAALDRLTRLPDGDRFLHGDFHPGNVILGPGGPQVIDWVDASRGHPAADVARTLWLSSPAAVGPTASRRIRATARRLRDRYLQRYLSLTGISRAAVDEWRLPVIAGRLSEGIEHETKPILKEISRLARG
jgi:aminoglycoside phosphotransferase (APT) family kinase protein